MGFIKEMFIKNPAFCILLLSLLITNGITLIENRQLKESLYNVENKYFILQFEGRKAMQKKILNVSNKVSEKSLMGFRKVDKEYDTQKKELQTLTEKCLDKAIPKDVKKILVAGIDDG